MTGRRLIMVAYIVVPVAVLVYVCVVGCQRW